jgi:hypothetical protein
MERSSEEWGRQGKSDSDPSRSFLFFSMPGWWWRRRLSSALRCSRAGHGGGNCWAVKQQGTTTRCGVGGQGSVGGSSGVCSCRACRRSASRNRHLGEGTGIIDPTRHNWNEGRTSPRNPWSKAQSVTSLPGSQVRDSRSGTDAFSHRCSLGSNDHEWHKSCIPATADETSRKR